MSAAENSVTPPKIRRLLMVRLSAMGDIIHALPAVTALREVYPEAIIGWLVEERWAELLCARSTPRSGPRSPQRPLVDQVHTVDTKLWRKDMFSTPTRRAFAKAIKELRAPSYEVTIDFQGLIRSAVFALLSGTLMRFGFKNPREYVANWFYAFPVAARGTHVIQQNLSLAEAVAWQTLKMPRVELPRDEAAEREIENRLTVRHAGKFALMNPGAGWGAKQWPAGRYGAAARALVDDGIQSLVNFGPGEESLAQAVEDASEGAAQRVSCSLAELIALTRRASLFIGGDTGPMHLAAALDIPVVAIFGPTDPARNGPFSAKSKVLRDASSVTSHSRRAEPDPGLLKISVEQVVAAARELLGML